MSTPSSISQYDVTNSLELLFDVRIVNQKLGITKDSSQTQVLTPVEQYYDTSRQVFLQDTLQITSDDLVATLTVGNIISPGVLQEIYTDFSAYVQAYFGNSPIGFSSLYAVPHLPHTLLDTSGLQHLLLSQGTSDGSGATVGNLTGALTLTGVTQVLTDICNNNPFGNRDPSSATPLTGFLANDLIYVPTGGFNLTLSVQLEALTYELPITHTGEFSGQVGAQQSQSMPGTCVLTNTTNSTQIRQTYAIALLLRLANLS